MLGKVVARVRNNLKLWGRYSDDPDCYRWVKHHAPRLRKFSGIHTGEDCFIIGNGPSLNKMDLQPLQNYHTFGLNKIFLMEDRVDLNLSYHVAVNQLVIQQCVTEFQKLACPSFVAFQSAENLLDASENMYHVYTAASPFVAFYKDLEKPISQGWTVTFVALQIAFYMGFQRVFLIGVDHSFKVDGKANERQFLTGEDPNHFSPDYFGGKQWDLPDLEGSEINYHLAKFMYERADRKIYDATLDGQLTIFPKIRFEEALDLARRKL